jgi:hypothetical protein
MEYKDAAAAGWDVASPARTRVVRVRLVLPKVQVPIGVLRAIDILPPLIANAI